LEVGFLHDNNPDRIYDDLRNLVARADLDAREVTIVLGIIRQIEWKIRSTSGARD
jgi:tRNA C32,U32 (ribose-2'-O)-methylase TrmJ